MKTSARIFGGLALAASLVCFSSFALAQPAPPGPPPGPERRQAWMAEHQAHRQEAMQARVERLRAVLNLRPDQESALKALTDSLTPPPHDEMKPDDHQAMDKLTTPERLDRMASRMAEHQAMFERHAAALKSFYAALSPEQQRAFDALPGLMVGEHDHMGHKGPDGMGMHGMGGEPMDHPGGPQ